MRSLEQIRADNDTPIYVLTSEQLRELVFQAAGAATAPLMADHPDYEFPSQRVEDAVNSVLKQFVKDAVNSVLKQFDRGVG